MAETTKIEWADATWNVGVGCKKVSPACKHCYMMRDEAKKHRDPTVFRRTTTVFDLPVKRDRAGHWKIPDGSLVFTSSLTDFFLEDVDAIRPEAWEIIRRRPGLLFLILTKRPERLASQLPPDWGDGTRYFNVALGVSVESADYRWRAELLRDTPAVQRFISAEPLLGPLDVEDLLRPYGSDEPGIDWIIAGGESGWAETIRPTHPAWVRSLRDQAARRRALFHFKQWGEYAQAEDKPFEDIPFEDWLLHVDGHPLSGRPARPPEVTRMHRFGKKKSGRVLDGRTHDERLRALGLTTRPRHLLPG